MWQAPDEQSHFAELNYIVEKNDWVGRGTKDLSREILVSEEFLGTKRDASGNNKFTYRPEYKIAYTRTQTGKYENLINNQSVDSRRAMVGTESAGYPPLYYLLSVPVYNAVYQSGIINRLFTVRLVSVVLNILLVLVTYYIGLAIWGKKSMALTLGLMVGFQPMVSFVAAGFHPDNLLNLIAATAILVTLLILKKGVSLGRLSALGILCFLGVETKQFMVFLIPSLAAIVVYKVFRNNLIASGLVLLAPLAAFIFQWPIPNMPAVSLVSPLGKMTFLEYLHFRLPKTVFEIWPWFWGVFKWLGVTLPPLVLKVITRAAVLAGLGLGLKIFLSRERKIIFVLGLFPVTYYLYMILWDWRLMQSMGYSLGLQGRYFFPVVVPIMAIFIFGLVPRRFTNIVLASLIAGMIVLNVAALSTVVKSYYDHVYQVAQYKPEIVKQAISLFL